MSVLAMAFLHVTADKSLKTPERFTLTFHWDLYYTLGAPNLG